MIALQIQVVEFSSIITRDFENMILNVKVLLGFTLVNFI